MNTPTTYTPPPGQYQGTELRTPPGMTADRLRAFTPPSRVGPFLRYPNGTVYPFPGALA